MIGTSYRKSGVFFIKAFDDNVQLLILALLMDFFGNTCLQRHQLMIAVFLNLRLNLVFHSAGHSTLLLGILEYACVFKALLFNKVHQLRKILIGFTGEAHNKGSADSNSRNTLTQLGQKLLYLRACIVTVHAVEQSVAGMLQRNINILAHLVAFGEGCNQIVRKVVGIQVHNANPLNALQLVEITQKLRQKQLAGEVLAIAGGVLRHDNQLLDAVSSKASCLCHNLIIRTAGVGTAQLRNNAVGAAVVAALSNFQIRHVTRRSQHSGRSLHIFAFQLLQMLYALACQHLVDNPTDIGKAVGADDSVNLRHAFEKLVCITLAEAACHNQILAAALLLVLRHL